MSDRDNRGGASEAEIHQIIARQIKASAGVDAKYLPGPDVPTSGEWLWESPGPRKVFVLSRAYSTALHGSSATVTGIYGDYWSALRAGGELGAACPWMPESDGVWNSVAQRVRPSEPPAQEWFVVEEHEVKP